MNWMIPNSIASEPTKGWRNQINQSQEALEWLTWCDHQQRQQALASSDHPHPSHRQYIQHVRNADEYRIPGTKFLVDGYCQDTHIVYEFQGCFFHGCPRCYPNRHEHHVRHCDRTMQDVYETTQQKLQALRALGYHVVEMWGCDWKRLKETSPDLQTFVDSLEFVDPLNPRDAFCGGRTNAIKLYHRVTPGQKIHYIDYHLLVPLGQQNLRVPQRASSLHLPPGSHRHPPLLWPHPMPCSLRVHCTTPCCLTAMRVNSPFPSVRLVSKKKCPNVL